jgi:hypothetical protein
MSPDPEAVEWFERTRGIKAAKEQGDVPTSLLRWIR